MVPKIASIIEYFPSTSISLKFYYGDNPCSIVRPINLYLCICKIRRFELIFFKSIEKSCSSEALLTLRAKGPAMVLTFLL